MCERKDNEDDNEPEATYLKCVCGNEFAKHEGFHSEYLSHQLDEETYFCCEGCHILNEHGYMTDHSFDREYKTIISGITYTVTHTATDDMVKSGVCYRIDEIEIMDDDGKYLHIFFPSDFKLDDEVDAKIKDYIWRVQPNPKQRAIGDSI